MTTIITRHHHVVLFSWILEREELTATEKILYSVLSGECSEEGHTIITIPVLASRLGVSTKTVERSLKHLADLNLIETERFMTGRKYFFLQHPWMSE